GEISAFWHYSTAIRAEEADPDKRCHQSVPSDRSISTLVNEAGQDDGTEAQGLKKLSTELRCRKANKKLHADKLLATLLVYR
ncbi:hypothetical protein R3F72_18375, partial [Salinicola sp. 4072]|uniref:hypothetical protein n=1 Tax=Salinicola sp. 4072 TaxID=3082157 RepID=UPI002FC5FD01